MELVSDRKLQWDRRRKMVEDCYPGGLAAFQACWRKDASLAFLHLMNGLKAADKIEYVRELVSEYWGRLPEAENVVADIVEGYLRLESSLERQGMSPDDLVAQDMDRVMKKSGGQEGRL